MVKVGERQNKWAKIEKPSQTLASFKLQRRNSQFVKTTQSKTQVKFVLKTTTIIEMATLFLNQKLNK
jgi:hypothetical protein